MHDWLGRNFRRYIVVDGRRRSEQLVRASASRLHTAFTPRPRMAAPPPAFLHEQPPSAPNQRAAEISVISEFFWTTPRCLRLSLVYGTVMNDCTIATFILTFQ